MAKEIEMLLLDGTPEGPKTALITSWVGRATYSPVERAGEILKRAEFDRPGVYILKSPPQRHAFTERVYIGQSGTLRDRLRTHLAKSSRRSFDAFVAFTSTDTLLNINSIKYLEHRLIKLAHDNKTSEVENKQDSKAPPMSEGKRYSMNDFLGNMQILLPLLGFEFTNPTVLLTAPNQESAPSPEKEPAPDPVTPPSKKEESPIQQAVDLYRIKSTRLKAFMYIKDGHIVVTKGSQMKYGVSKSIGANWIRLREKLMLEGLVVRDGKHYRFTEDVVFSSTSAASSTVLGRQTAGPRSWVHTENGRTYRELLLDGLLE
ncbi:MAG: GIY-YIG nuclease family protein [Bacteroidota bacterium]